MPTLPDWAIQVLQVVVVIVLAPLASGIIARVEGVIQQRRGLRVLLQGVTQGPIEAPTAPVLVISSGAGERR